MIDRYSFVGGNLGPWRVAEIRAIRGEGLKAAGRLDVVQGEMAEPPEAAWVLRGVVSNVRYSTAAEAAALRAVSPPLGRAEATQAALIPIRKSEAWWALAQDERRAIFEETSRHTAIGSEYVPAVARRLHHSRDLSEPFDFLTWFEFAPADANSFEALVARLRATPEWDYVEREVEIRLER